jgi:A/G-specific adenine glycosylase
MNTFANILKNWFLQNRRDLPWRQSSNPYWVWISEIILQQTRVDQGLSYFQRFINKFPDIQSLAHASENEVLLLWQGLGYYSRARNIHAAAQQIMKDHHGVFPDSHDQIRNLKGIGPYTAAAIASISFGLPFAVIDGNVYRVLARIFGISSPVDSPSGQKEFAELAESLLNKEDPGNYNEAIMDFGALQCKPKSPLCDECPFQDRCEAYKLKKIEQYPVKSKRIIQSSRYFNYLFIKYEQRFYLQKRKANDIWRNLYELPLIESSLILDEKELFSSKDFRKFFKNSDPVIKGISSIMVHKLSHQILNIRFINIAIKVPLTNTELILVNQLANYPLPKPIERYLLSYDI